MDINSNSNSGYEYNAHISYTNIDTTKVYLKFTVPLNRFTADGNSDVKLDTTDTTINTIRLHFNDVGTTLDYSLRAITLD
jgi:hypothetical protein